MNNANNPATQKNWNEAMLYEYSLCEPLEPF